MKTIVLQRVFHQLGYVSDSFSTQSRKYSGEQNFISGYTIVVELIAAVVISKNWIQVRVCSTETINCYHLGKTGTTTN